MSGAGGEALGGNGEIQRQSLSSSSLIRGFGFKSLAAHPFNPF
jgi:hypothetical protein